MFRNLIKNKKAQNVAEYAILIALVVAAIFAIQTWLSRLIQARLRDAGKFYAQQTSELGTETQYEAYYASDIANVATDSDETQLLGVNQVERQNTSTTTRVKDSKRGTSATGLTNYNQI